MQAVILAAGRGARLRPLTNQRSKAMLPVLGQPMLQRVIDSLEQAGLREFIIVVNPGDQAIQDYFARAVPPGTQVQFAYQISHRGMADALLAAAPLIKNEFILSACDSLLPGGQIQRLLAEWHGPRQPKAVLALLPVPVEKISSTGIVALDGDWVQRIVEKPTLAEAPSNIASLPLYIFPQAFLDYLPGIPVSPRGEYELQTALQTYIDRQGGVLGVQVDFRLTITRPVDLLTINRYFLANQQPAIYKAAGVGMTSQWIPPVYIGEQVTIGEGCVIGPNVYIEGPCQVGHHSTIQEAVILRDVQLAENSLVTHTVTSAAESSAALSGAAPIG